MKDTGKVLLLLVAAVALVACGGGSTGKKTDSGEDVAAVDVGFGEADVVDVVDERVTGDKRLSFGMATGDDGKSCQDATICTIVLSYTADRDLPVLYKQAGKAIADAAITYEIQNDTKSLCEMSSAMAYTGADGKAVAKVVNKKQEIGTLQVKVCANGEADVPCLTFNVAVTPKGYAPLTVGFETYNGIYKSELTNAEVRLFKQGANGKPTCADLKLESLPAATVSSPTLASLTQTAVFPELPNLDKEVTQKYTILGLAKNDASTVKAYGCEDVKGQVEWGAMQHVDLKLIDLPPRIKGAYELTSTFDLVSGLPPEVANIVYTITGFFTNPAAEILKLICNAAGGNQTMNDFCGFLFNDPSDPNITELTATGEIVFQIVNALLIGILESYCPFEDKTLCSKIYWTGNDVSAILTKFQLLSTMQVNCEPDAAGVLAADCVEESWHSVRLRWTLGMDCPPNDENCGWKKFGFSQISGMESTISAKPAVTIVDQKMSIEKHPLNLKYGALINFALEKWLLPMLLGDGTDGLPVVDSYEAMIGSLLAGKACLADGTCCEAFAENVAKQATGVTKNLVEGACEALITTGSNYLRNTLTGLAASPEAFKLGTKDPCQLYDKNKDMKYDAIGQKDAQCEWDTTLTIGSADYSPVGTFWGTAK